MQDAAATAQSQYQNTEDHVLSFVRKYVKQGINYAEEYPYAAYGAAGSALLLFPQPRAFLFRNVFGILQSQVCSAWGLSNACRMSN